MKKIVRMFSSMLIVALLVTVLPTYALAANVEERSTADAAITAYELYTNFRDPIRKRAKENDSQVYIWLKDIGFQSSGVMVQAVGMNSGTSYANCTIWEGSPVTEVVVYEGTQYGIDNTIHDSYDNASLRLRCHQYIVQDIINTGYWSADSSKEYTTPPFGNE